MRRRNGRLVAILTIMIAVLLCVTIFCEISRSNSYDLDFDKDQLAIIQQRLLRLTKSEDDVNVNASLPIIFAITPTYSRYEQKAELTRISQTLQLVPKVHWIVVEDSERKTNPVRNVISHSNLLVTHLNTRTKRSWIPWGAHHRGVEQRNAGLKWLRDNFSLGRCRGVVYFMDDDNSYDVTIFKEMAKIRKVGVWPVGLTGGFNVEAPVVDRATGKVTKFISGWEYDRPFPVDMAGFAINLDLILSKKNGYFTHNSEGGFLESDFLSLFTTKEELEPLAEYCTQVYVWHTRTQKTEVWEEISGFEV